MCVGEDVVKLAGAGPDNRLRKGIKQMFKSGVKSLCKIGKYRSSNICVDEDVDKVGGAGTDNKLKKENSK